MTLKMSDVEKAERRRKQHAEACARYKLKHPDKFKAIIKKATGKSIDKRKRDKLLKRYGLTEREYDDLLLKQEGHCALCPATTYLLGQQSRLAVDHDHVTKKVRGILCHACNLMLGYARDVPEQLEKGASYLRSHKQE